MCGALSMDMLATDVAEYLVRKGVPFRTTHHISGQAVKLAEQRQCSLQDLTMEEWTSLHPLFDTDITLLWDFEASVEKRRSLGGTSRDTVLLQVQQLRERIKSE
jgi:argininosuccinate lyase